MGHLEDTGYLSAVVLAGVIFNIVYWSLGFLRMGTTGMTAQAYGKDDQKEAITILSQALIVALGLAVVVLFLQQPIAYLGFALMDDSAPDVMNWAQEYFFIRIWAAPATVCLYALNGWFLGMQNARFPMFITILINVVNVVLNFFFVYSLGMTSDGVALGTLIAQYSGLCLALFLLWKEYGVYWDDFDRKLAFQWTKVQRFFTVNSDIFLRTTCFIAVFSFFTIQLNKEGEFILNANSILLQYFYIMSYGVDGFAYAAESLTGRFKGANDTSKLKTSIAYSFYWGLGFGLCYTIIYAIFAQHLIGFFTDDLSVITAGKPYLIWLIIIPLFGAAAFIWDGIYGGATETKIMRNTTAIATFAFYFPCYYLLYPYIGLHALWLGLILFMAARSVLLTWYAKRVIFN